MNRNGAPGCGSGIQRQALELGLEPFGGAIAAGAVARRLLVELGLQHRQVERRVLGDRVIDDRLDARGQPVLHAVRHVGAEPGGRQHRRAEAPAARRDASAVGGRLPARQPAQPGIDRLADLRLERPLHGYTVARRGRFERVRGRRAPPRLRAAIRHSSTSSSHGHRGRSARVRTSAMPPHADAAAGERDDEPEPRRRDAPAATPVAAASSPLATSTPIHDAADVAEVARTPRPHSARPDTTDAARAARATARAANADRWSAWCATTPGTCPSPGASTMSAFEDEAHHAEPEDQQRDEGRPSRGRARRAGGPGRRRSPRGRDTPTRG